MADLSEYQAAADRAMDALCEEIEVPRALMCRAVEAKQAVEAAYWLREDLVLGAIRSEQQPGEDFMQAWARCMSQRNEMPS